MQDYIPNQITEILTDSIAEEIALQAGDILISVNGNPIHDIVDYKFEISDEYVELEIQRDNEVIVYEIEKEFDEDIGIRFANPLIEDAKSCRNHCIFCFIDQLPKGMRETLYYKDDDSRLSFLQGNFVTLTNISDQELDRIIAYRMSPIKISVHTTDPELRYLMLKNPNAKKIMRQLRRLYDGKIPMHAQIVLVPGINDKEHLIKTIKDLSQFFPYLESVAVVPVGITRFREGLALLTPYKEDSARDVIQQVNELQKMYLSRIGTRFVFLSDEFYALSNAPLPNDYEYEGYPQIENGVGLLTNLYEEIKEEIKKTQSTDRIHRGAILTGTLAAPYLRNFLTLIMPYAKKSLVDVIPIKNHFFGETVTVAGLVTGGDILLQFSDFEKYDTIWVPESMLRAQSDMFLDDVRIQDLQNAFQRNVVSLRVSGASLVQAIVGG